MEADHEVVAVSEEQATVALSGMRDLVELAKRHPRNLSLFKDELLALATIDLPTAESCSYALPKDGKSIEGPSIRLAEIAASTYGNLHVGCRVLNDDGRFVYAEAVAFDMQRLTQVTVRTKRRITKKNGDTYGEDMIQTTGNAAAAIAFREAVFKVIPKAFIMSAYNDAMKLVAEKNQDNLPEAIKKSKAFFDSHKVEWNDVLRFLSIDGDHEITGLHITRLRQIANGIKEGYDPSSYFGKKQPKVSKPLDMNEKGQE
jgi:hypothetical protein